MDAAVVEVLQQATSQDPTILKPAEQTLKQWETERGFYTALYVSRKYKYKMNLIKLNY